jgi:VIT1/CCC1 family predicted Fe2+/Mn2+ transporter
MSVRPFVLSANDGIVSIATLIVGIQGANVAPGSQVVTGILAAIAGAMSMSVGEYVSVSAAVDAETTDENPRRAVVVSALSFLAGASVPLLAMSLAPGRPLVVALASIIALIAVGYVSHPNRESTGVMRVVSGGSLAFIVTYGLGVLGSK